MKTSRLDKLHTELKARYETLRKEDSMENLIKRSELIEVIERVQDLLIQELEEEVKKLENQK